MVDSKSVFSAVVNGTAVHTLTGELFSKMRLELLVAPVIRRSFLSDVACLWISERVSHAFPRVASGALLDYLAGLKSGARPEDSFPKLRILQL